MPLSRFSRTAVAVLLSFLLGAGSTLLLAQSVPPLSAEASSKIDDVVGYPDKTLQINIYEMPDGKFEQFLIFAVE